MKKYKVGSLFSGIGGFELGIERAIPRAETVWQVEQNKYCQSILKKHWPNATIYDDVRNITKHNVEPVDILIGGFPCQSISTAGKLEGLENENKSGLWWEFHRIISELRPPIVIMENVANVLRLGGRDVVGSLAKIGYDCEWTVISAKQFGAPHLRKRWFCVAYPHKRRENSTISARGKESSLQTVRERKSTDSNCEKFEQSIGKSIRERDRKTRESQPRELLFNDKVIQDITRKHHVSDSNGQRPQTKSILAKSAHGKTCQMPEYGSWSDVHVTDSECQRMFKQSNKSEPVETKIQFISRSGKNKRPNIRNYWQENAPESPLCSVDDGIPRRVARLKALGNAIVPQCSEYIGNCIVWSGLLDDI